MADSETQFGHSDMSHLVFYIQSFMVNRQEQEIKAIWSAHRTASTTDTKQKTRSSAAAGVKVSAPSSTHYPVTTNGHPKPQPAYKGSKSSTSVESKEIQGQAAADLPAISDAIQGLLDLWGGSPGVKDLETVSSEGEEEAVKPTKRKRKQAESEEGEEDKDEKSSDSSDDEEDEGTQIGLTTF